MNNARKLLLRAKILLLRRGVALEVPGGGGGSSGNPGEPIGLLLALTKAS